MPDFFDYAKDKLYINGLQVSRLTMTGLLAERVTGVGRDKEIGSSGISPADLPSFLEVSLDGFRMPRKVCCGIADRTLAVEVARVVRSRLCGGRLGLDMVSSMVPVLCLVFVRPCVFDWLCAGLGISMVSESDVVCTCYDTHIHTHPQADKHM